MRLWHRGLTWIHDLALSMSEWVAEISCEWLMVCDIGHSEIVYMDMFDILPLDVCVWVCLDFSLFEDRSLTMIVRTKDISLVITKSKTRFWGSLHDTPLEGHLKAASYFSPQKPFWLKLSLDSDFFSYLHHVYKHMIKITGIIYCEWLGGL